MTVPIEITFHGIDKSEAVEARIHEKMARLIGLFDRLTHARVVISSPNRTGPRAKMFQVKIDLGVPGQAPVVVNQDSGDGHTDVFMALKDAFSAAQRQLEAIRDRMTHPARREQTRRKPQKGETT